MGFVKDVQCYELYGGIALKNHAFSFFISILSERTAIDTCNLKYLGILISADLQWNDHIDYIYYKGHKAY